MARTPAMQQALSNAWLKFTGIVQRERPVVQGPGLHGKEPGKSFVERANLLNRPLRTRTVGGVGGDG
jgi:hypothetical protein